MSDKNLAVQQIVNHVQSWLETMILGLNLCPFARPVVRDDRVRIAVTDADEEALLLQALLTELVYLDKHPATATTLLVHPHALADFAAYNDFLAFTDELLDAYGYAGVYQVASFHPDFQYHATAPDAAENFANRSPYPLLHILREADVAQAVQDHPQIEDVPRKNIERLNSYGSDGLLALWRKCFQVSQT